MNKNVSSASKQEENSFTSPLSSTVITRDEIRTYGCSTVEEALRLVPGMMVSEKLPGVFDVQMRGLSNIPDNNMYVYTENMNILVMVDGRITHNYAVGMPSLENLPISIEDIERVEVVRGATSSLYGPNAVQGVINIITQKPDNAQAQVSGSLKLGNNFRQAEGALRKTFGKLSLGLTYNMQRHKRAVNTLYLAPSSNTYIINDKSLFDGPNYYMSNGNFATGLASGKIEDVSEGKHISLNDYSNYYTASGNDENGIVFSYKGLSNIEEAYPDIEMGRRNDGINAYVTFVPKSDIRFDLTAGYQYSYQNNTQVGQDNVSVRGREFSTFYTNLNADIKNLKLLANYYQGCNHYCMGAAGFQMYNQQASVSAEYTIKVGELGIKPGVGYQYIKLKDHKPEYLDYNDGTGVHETSGFWGYYSQGNDNVENDDISGSLRLDYKHEGLRLIGAGRFDKTTIPDDFNPSWQFVASYEINDRNFIRANYGRARRSAAFVNTSSNYNWHNASMPHWIQFMGNEDASLVKIDNFELGYRWKPTAKVLVDAEAFYSISQDYGQLKAYKSMLTLSSNDLTTILGGLMTGQLTSEQAGAMLPNMFGSKAYIRYDSMPFKVYQKGIGVNVDWIISPKLIAKVNANVQQTKIDDYYQYSQADMIRQQLLTSAAVTTANITPLIGEIMYNVQVDATAAATQVMMNGGTAEEAQVAGLAAAQKYVGACTGYTPVHPYREQYEAMSDSEKQTYLAGLLQKYAANEMIDGNVRPLGLYYAMKYNIEYNTETDEYYFGSSVAENPETQNGYKHKACPSFYGNIGLIYKPTEKLSLSTFAYFMSKREICTIFGTQDIDPVFTMNFKAGYKPVSNCEVFFEAHNLLNSNKSEFAYTDKIKGTYSLGINFAF
ncbi:MAG: TonB-dependent receptor plug domain-containing protein [Bacteroidales bacterium]|nr:TonB-dependent receptor plug domain-containing protein [Bacteroidales bacterium]